MNIQILIARTLRWGVGIACLIGLVGGILYLVHHGSEPFDPSVYRVLVLILTPILRVALSLIDFLKERDWLYAFITAVVLAVILINSFEGMK